MNHFYNTLSQEQQQQQQHTELYNTNSNNNYLDINNGSQQHNNLHHNSLSSMTSSNIGATGNGNNNFTLSSSLYTQTTTASMPESATYSQQTPFSQQSLVMGNGQLHHTQNCSSDQIYQTSQQSQDLIRLSKLQTLKQSQHLHSYPSLTASLRNLRSYEQNMENMPILGQITLQSDKEENYQHKCRVKETVVVRNSRPRRLLTMKSSFLQKQQEQNMQSSHYTTSKNGKKNSIIDEQYLFTLSKPINNGICLTRKQAQLPLKARKYFRLKQHLKVFSTANSETQDKQQYVNDSEKNEQNDENLHQQQKLSLDKLEKGYQQQQQQFQSQYQHSSSFSSQNFCSKRINKDLAQNSSEKIPIFTTTSPLQETKKSLSFLNNNSNQNFIISQNAKTNNNFNSFSLNNDTLSKEYMQKTKAISKQNYQQKYKKIPKQLQIMHNQAKRNYQQLREGVSSIIEDQTILILQQQQQQQQQQQNSNKHKSQQQQQQQQLNKNNISHSNILQQQQQQEQIEEQYEQIQQEGLKNNLIVNICNQVSCEQKEILLRKFEDQYNKNKLQQEQLKQQQQQQMNNNSTTIANTNSSPTSSSTTQQQQQQLMISMSSTLFNNQTVPQLTIQQPISQQQNALQQIDLRQRILIGTPSESDDEEDNDDHSDDNDNESQSRISASQQINHQSSSSFSQQLDDISNSQSLYSNISSSQSIRPFELLRSNSNNNNQQQSQEFEQNNTGYEHVNANNDNYELEDDDEDDYFT